MRRNQQRFLKLGISILGALTLSAASPGQASPDSAAAGLPSDWSQHHVIFSKPADAEQAKRVETDPRYWQQMQRQSAARSQAGSGALAPELQNVSKATRHGKNSGLKGDWSQDIGPAATVGAMNYPAKFSFLTSTANCASAPQPDFVVYATGLTGSTTQASIAAYDNIYSGCTGMVPMVYWAYNTNGGTVTTSPVFSQDGTQVAFVQTGPAGNGNLVLLKWAASATDTIGSPTNLSRTRNSLYPACAAPCMTSTVLRDALGTLHPDTNSSVFYDYATDSAYVGDDAGWLHQFKPVFKGVPNEVRSGGWPVQVNPTTPTALSSPVYDSTSGRIFVADVGGFLYRVGPNTAFVATSSGPLDVSFSEGGSGFVQGPVVDSTAEVVYVFAASDGSAACPGGADCSAVYQLAVNFPQNDVGSETTVGSSTIFGSAPSPLYIGGFDSTYLNSVNATGNLYVCGNTGGPPVLYQVPIVASAMNITSIPGPVLSTSIGPTPCSPVTDVLNPNVTGGATEWMFASVNSLGASSGCAASGCVFNFKDTPWQPLTAYTVGQEILDNHFQIQVVTVAGTSGAAAPAWQMLGRTTTDATVRWISQGVQSAFTPGAWTANHLYSKGVKILAGTNIQLVTTAGRSGATIPTFNGTAGGVTNDGTAKWTNVGVIGTAAVSVAGGTSGIIWDNTVGSGTQPGASQVYFSTLNGGCGAGTDGCAVQASQPALQ
jgi:hypothetical protein